MALVEPIAEAAELGRTVALLGGQRTLHRIIRTPLETHDLLHAGLPVRALDHLINGLHSLRRSDQAMELAVGISSRTYYRRKKDLGGKPLSREQSGRVWKFAEILARATGLFGSQEAAERWLEAPAMGLDQRRPIDLLSTPAGVDTLETHLTRIEYGVYA
jgi:putative toxin-antitoxin system antitoxin component (TIGR02293 family)